MTIKLNTATGGGSVSLSAPNSTTSNLDVELTLPVDDGAANTFLKSDGAGTLSWASASSDSITEGNTSAEVVDTGSDGHFKVVTEGTEALRITAAQRVGIGTASPNYILETAGDPAFIGVGTSVNGAINIIGRNSAGSGTAVAKIESEPSGATNASSLIFKSKNTSNQVLEGFRLDSSQRLLVGTPTSLIPALLTVSGGDTDAGGTIEIRNGRTNPSGEIYTNHYIGGVGYRNNSNQGYASIACYAESNTSASNSAGRLVFATTASGATSPTERMRISSGGYVEIGQVGNPGAPINSTGFRFMEGNGFWWSTTGANSYWNVNTQTFLNFRYNGSQSGSIVINNGSTNYNTSSDYRIKENVVDLDGAITRLKQLEPKRFNFIATPERTVDGFLAHEVQTVVPEAISGVKDQVEVWTEDEDLPDGVSVGDNKLDEDGNTIPLYQGIDQAKLVPLLTAALQEAIAKIETLETANASLEARLTALEGGAS